MSEHHEDRRVDGGMRPEYVDFDVDEFPGGLAACLEAMLMVSDQPQQPADLARVLAVDEPQVTAALEALRREYDGDAESGRAPRDSSCVAAPGDGSSPAGRCSNRWSRRS